MLPHAARWAPLAGAFWALGTAACFRTGFYQEPPPNAGAEDAACAAVELERVEADQQSPSVRFSAPAGAQTASGEIDVCARASDDVHLVGVRFWLGETLLGAEDHVAPYCHRLDTRGLPNGAHMLRAVARDAAGNEAQAELGFTSDNGPRITGATYYACGCAAGADADCQPGDDAADGRSPDAAVQSALRVQQLVDRLACGDALLLCDGGAVDMTAPLVLPPLDCAQTPVRLGAYAPPWGSGDEARPLLVQTGNGDGLAIRDDNGALSGVEVADLHLACDGCDRAGIGYGVFMNGTGVGQVALRRLEVEGFFWGIYVGECVDVAVEYNQVHHNLQLGLAVGGPGLRVRYNRLRHNGCIDAPSDDLCAQEPSMFIGYTYLETPLEIVGNEITRTAVDRQGFCRSVGIQLNGGGRGTLVEGNYVYEPLDQIREGCTGIEAWGNVDEVSSFCYDCSVSRNRVENTAAGIVVSSHQGSIVASNTVALPPAPSSATPCVGVVVFPRVDPLDLETSDVSVVNNSVFIDRGDAGCAGVMVGAEGTGHLVANNAVLYQGTGTGFACLRVDQPERLAAADHNVCDAAGAEPVAWARTSSAVLALAEWQALGYGARSALAPPRFENAAAPVLSLAPLPCAAELIDRGADAWCPATDQGGAARPQGGACDVGAHER